MNMRNQRNTRDGKEDNARYRLQVKAQILNGTITNLGQIDWRRITDCYENESLEAFIHLFDFEDLNNKTKLLLALIDNCLDSFKPYIQNECPLNCLNYGVEEAAFYRYAQSLREKIEQSNRYNIAAILGTPKTTIPLPSQLDNDKARECLSRLVPQFCSEDLDWKDKTNKRNMAEVAFVLSGLLDLDKGGRICWNVFERLWHVSNLRQAYDKMNGKAISKTIADLYSEYKNH